MAVAHRCGVRRALFLGAVALLLTAFVGGCGARDLAEPPPPTPAAVPGPSTPGALPVPPTVAARPAPPAPSAVPAPPATSSSAVPGLAPYGMSDADIQSYLDDCARNVNRFKSGAGLTYPRSLGIELNATVAYTAVVNLDGSGSPELVPNGVPTKVPVSVRCQITAQLVVPPDDSLKVTDPGDDQRSFLPTGRVDWSWPVTALKPGHHDLQLVLQPALTVGLEAFPSDPSTQRLTFVTGVDVRASLWQHAKLWAQDNWTGILAGATALGAALLGLVKWFGSFREAWAAARRGERHRPAEAAAPAPQDADREERTGYL